MDKVEILEILESASDKNDDVPMRLVRKAFEKLPDPCVDAVSRDQVRRLLASIRNSVEEGDGYDYDLAVVDLDALPPVKPERKIGDWIQRPRYNGDTQPMLECPYCQNEVGWWDLARYCNGCGARLKGGAGDDD